VVDRRRPGVGAPAERLIVEVHRVLHLDDLHESQPHRVVLSGQPILLAKLDGEPHAITDVCPHNGSSLSEGIIRDGCVTCPAHLWRFSLHDGTRQGTPEVRLQVDGTRLTAEGWVEVEVPEAVPTRSLRETLLAHARGEDVDSVR
jgi:nitrite reductase/ring-hydroxylating ferredoxin subunit